MKLKRYVLATISVLLATLMCACSPSIGEQPVGSDTEIAEKDVVLFGGANDYKIIYSTSVNSRVKDLMTQMKAKVKDATGKAPELATDTSKSNKETPCEILLGVTTRTESKDALSAMSAIGYDVRFIGEKLVITASNDLLLERAVDALFETWRVENNRVILSNKTLLTCDASDSMRSLYNNGAFEYKVVVPMKCSDALYDDAVYLAQNLSAATGTPVDICYDEKTEELDGAYEICLGKTSRKISQELYDSLGSVFEYKTVTSGNRIAVGALQDFVISQAVRLLYSDLYNEIKYAYSGTPIISADYGDTYIISETAAELPTIKAGSFYGVYKSDDNKYVIYTENVSEKDYEDYVSLLKDDGSTLLKEYSFESNRYSLLSNGKYTAYVSYLPTEGAIRTYVGPPDASYPLQSEEISANEATPMLWQLDVDTVGSYSNGGMSYVLRLTDGSFIIIDGGYNTSTEADNLYTLLRENTPEGEVPTISGWFITHLHPDHYGALMSFATRYSGVTEVKAFYYNFPAVPIEASSNPIDTGVAKNIVAAMKKWKNAQRYDTLHSGTTIGFAGATADVLCTHEDVYPLSFIDGNDTCTVVGITVAGQRILFLGDARDSQSATMLNTIPVSKLKADIVQVSHHGYEGCTEAFYRTVSASVALWPMNIIGKVDGVYTPVFKNWYTNSNPANRYLRTSATIKKIIISGEGTQGFLLPYTPMGDRIADYEAIYNERLSQT